MSTKPVSSRSTTPTAGDAPPVETTEERCDHSSDAKKKKMKKKKGGEGHDDDEKERASEVDDDARAATDDDAAAEGASPSRTTTTTTKSVESSLTSTTTTTTTTETARRRKSKTRTGTSSSAAAATNELTHLIPGYTAPMRLGAPSPRVAPGETLSDLRARASRVDAAAHAPPTMSARLLPGGGGARRAGGGGDAAGGGGVPTTTTTIRTNFGGGGRRDLAAVGTAGPGWFGMTPAPMTQSLKTDLSILRNRGYLDPKKFYKSSDNFAGKVLQVGTVIEGSAEFYSSRLTKRERRGNLTEEVMADAGVAGYAKRKYRDIQAERDRPGRRGAGGGKRGRK